MADVGAGPLQPRPWMMWALGASLLANVVVLGGGVGFWAAARREPAAAIVAGELGHDARAGVYDGVWTRELTPRTLIGALPPQQRRAAIRKVIREGRASVDLVRANMEAREAVLVAMFADDYNSEDVAQALERARETEARLVARGHEILLTVIDEIPPDQRGRALESLRAHLDRPVQHRRHRARPPGPAPG